MNTREDDTIYEFEEKPKEPKSTNASMGIYIFNWATLKKFLREDEKDIKSSNDFGKNIIPNMLERGKRLVAYPFEGYWKDVGTIDSLWEANMDLLKKNNELRLYDSEWKIYSENQVRPAHYIGEGAHIVNSLIVEGCIINGEIESSVLSASVYVGKNSVIRDSVIMPNVQIGDNVIIDKAIIGSDTIINNGCNIGGKDSIEVVPENQYLVSENQYLASEEINHKDICLENEVVNI